MPERAPAMTPIDASTETTQRAAAHAAPAAPPADPMMIGLPSFIVGSVALGLVLIGYVPAAAVGASLAVIIAATGLGLVIAATWAANLGQSAVARSEER